MKKMLSLAAMLAVLSYASPASAELTFSGDAAVRVRETSNEAANQAKDDFYSQYRVRLNASADLGDGYIFKAQLTNEAPNFTKSGTVALGGGGGWQTVGYGNSEVYTLGASQLYFGRFYGDSHYLVGRLPLNSTNNPIFDLTLYPKNPLDIPTTTFQNDRLFGANWGTKIGNGDLNVVVGVFDNISASDTAGTGDGLLNDGYAFVASYKTTIGNVTIEPEVLTAITKFDSVSQQTFSPTSASYGTPFHQGIRPVTFGANVGVPAGDLKLGFSGLYNIGKGTTPSSSIYAYANANVDYTGYLLRVKAEYGPFLAWYDYNKTTDNSAATSHEYTNQFVWAQYQFKVYQAAKGSLTIQPTLRYLTTSDHVGGAVADLNTSRLRSELWATVSF
ncbi:MAG: hypothetical protein HKK67_14515 [Chlorobiaceae bacterium]|nr:hypothetical protein [Chlorobiaceae bacterium]